MQTPQMKPRSSSTRTVKSFSVSLLAFGELKTRKEAWCCLWTLATSSRPRISRKILPLTFDRLRSDQKTDQKARRSWRSGRCGM